MRRPMAIVLRAAQALFGTLATESMVGAYLMAKGFALEWLSQGKQKLEKVTTLRDARETIRRLVKEMTAVVHSLFTGLVPEVNDLRLSARKALADRPDLVAALGVGRKRKGAPPTQGAETPPAPDAAAKPKPTRRNRIVAFSERARGTLSGALDRPEVVSMLESFGYTRDSIAGLLARVEALAAKEVEHEDRKRELLGANETFRQAMEELRNWLLPSKKRLMTALKGRQDLKKTIDAVE